MPIEGVSLAPDDAWKVANPTWQRIDTTYRVQAWSIDRGRQNEMGRTDTGTATVDLVDRTGAFDPTNPTSPFYNRLRPGPMGPLTQAGIALQNPTTLVWHVLFRGFVAAIHWVPYQTEQHANVTLELVDAFAVFAACEMAPDGSFGHEVFEGNIVFHEDGNTNATQTRINKVLDQVGWPASLRTTFTGNIRLQKTVYAPRATVLSVITDTADAEWPDIANVWMGTRNPGHVMYHGRYARFQDTVAEYQIAHWKLGDDKAAADDPEHDIVRISPPLTVSLDDTLLYTSALATPQNIHPDDIAGQYVTNAAGVTAIGLRTWSAENLATGGLTTPASATGNAETKKYANYVINNFGTPKIRVGQLTVKSRRPNTVSGQETWKVLCGVEISDVINLKTTHGGGGGFNTDFYVEGIHYQARPGGGIPYVELTLDVSPKGFYDVPPP